MPLVHQHSQNTTRSDLTSYNHHITSHSGTKMYSNFIFYEPFYIGIERLLDNSYQTKRKSDYLDPSNQGKHIDIPIIKISFDWTVDNKYRLDLHEDSENNVVTATFEFPRVPKDSVQLDFHNDKLTVSAETKKSEKLSDTGYTICEHLHGNFSRTLQLPQGVKVCVDLINLLKLNLIVFIATQDE